MELDIQIERINKLYQLTNKYPTALDIDRHSFDRLVNQLRGMTRYEEGYQDDLPSGIYKDQIMLRTNIDFEAVTLGCIEK